ncbi:T9SS type A sorting domain-containing protein [Flammeovirga sp. MY04]|uniref:T9SS type A sorting domain-containing protein n=1 Tax=Flammeovirga sp. MY04 TaxID=1191459 RepID=UPI00080627C8|nr:T9SS type A sorting domain-containing protein [Flammeovirga sp. MY04]ANQ47763.1 T9SS type A sorting domain-containing protein [Flammeovirga sp. MY04]
MKKILLLLLLIFITKLSLLAQTYSVSSSASGYVYIGTRGSLSDFEDEDGNSLPSWTGNYNVRIQSGKNVYIGNNSFDPDVVIDTLFVDGTINNTAYRTTCHFGTIIVSGTGNFNGDNHSGGRLYVNVQDIVLEDGAEFAVPSVGSNSYSGLNWTGGISVEDNVTLSTSGASNNLISSAQINALPGDNPKSIIQGTIDGIPSNVGDIVLTGNAALVTNLAGQTVDIYTQGNDLVIADSVSSTVTVHLDDNSDNAIQPSVDLTFAGQSAGTVTIATGENRVRSLTMNTTGTSGITLNGTLEIFNTSYNTSSLTLTNGILNTTTTNVLGMNEFSYVTNANYSWSTYASGGSDNSHINGPLLKTINYTSGLQVALSIVANNFHLIYPVGNGTKLREAGVAAFTANSAVNFRIEYHDNAHTNLSIDPMATVSAVSASEYWDVDRTSGSSVASVILTYDDESGVNNTYVSDVEVMHYDGTHWESQGQAANTTESNNHGILLSTSASSFSPFTLGGGSDHDLPVELVTFNAEVNDNDEVVLFWETATELNNSHFEIEASTDGRHFNKIGEVDGNGNSNVTIEYDFVVDHAHSVKYKKYRLKQVDFDGAFEYSNVVTINTHNLIHGTELSLYPVPAHGTIHARVSSDEDLENASAVILNALGVAVKTVDMHHMDTININDLNDGIYYLSISTHNGHKEVKRFIVHN